MERDEQYRVLKFLMRLSDTYTATRGQILMMEPKPFITKVFNLVSQEERQRYMKHGQATSAVAFQVSQVNQQSLLQDILDVIISRRIVLYVLITALLVTLSTDAKNYMDIHQDINLRVMVISCNTNQTTIPTLLTRMILGIQRKRMLLLWLMNPRVIPQTVNRM